MKRRNGRNLAGKVGIGLLLLPIVAAGVFFATSLSTSLRGQEAARRDPLIGPTLMLGRLVVSLDRERDLSIRHVLAGASGETDGLDAQQTKTDRTLEGFKAELVPASAAVRPEGFEVSVAQLEERFRVVQSRREAIEDGMLYQSEIRRLYGAVIDSVTGAARSLVAAMPPADRSAGRAYVGVLDLYEQSAREYELVASTGRRVGLDIARVGAVIAAQDNLRSVFRQFATPEQQHALDATRPATLAERLAEARRSGIESVEAGRATARAMVPWQRAKSDEQDRLGAALRGFAADLAALQDPPGVELSTRQAAAGCAAVLMALLLLLAATRRAGDESGEEPGSERMVPAGITPGAASDEQLRAAEERLEELRRKLDEKRSAA